MPRPRYAKGEEVELLPDAWDRFERALKAAARVDMSKPKPLKKKKRKKAKRA